MPVVLFTFSAWGSTRSCYARETKLSEGKNAHIFIEPSTSSRFRKAATNSGKKYNKKLMLVGLAQGTAFSNQTSSAFPERSTKSRDGGARATEREKKCYFHSRRKTGQAGPLLGMKGIPYRTFCLLKYVHAHTVHYIMGV